VWQRGWGTLQAQDLLTLMPTWARLDARAANLIEDAFPCSTSELLPEWEATLGLPDPCVGQLGSTQERTAAVCAKFSARGGQSISYYTALALSLGYDITIQQFAPFRVEFNRAEDPLYGEDWAYAWQVTVNTTQGLAYFRTGESTCGEPLASWGSKLLECMIQQYAPAHTTLIFAYITVSVWDGGTSLWDGGSTVWDDTLARQENTLP
jgi:uncharacterized protein YmfQ (DUF2313 family)